MSDEVIRWVISIGLLPCIGWGMHLTWMLYSQRRDTMKLVSDMAVIQTSLAESRQDFKNSLDANTRAISDLVHYIKWATEAQTGKAPPPPLPHEGKA